MSTATETRTQDKATKPSNTLAIVKTEVVDKTAAEITNLVQRGQIVLPADYSVENAMRSAWLKLQETIDKDKRPVLEVCSKVSIYNSLMNMAIQGMNVAKNQGYFIAYGKSLAFQRSYFGDIALVKRVVPSAEVTYEIVYEGDEFKYKIDRGQKIVTLHEQDIANVKFENIIAAYCTVWNPDGSVLKSEVMTIERIKQSWKQSKTYKEGNAYGTHHDFTDEMVLRTVIRKTCKPIINGSNDSMLLLAVRQSEVDSVDAEFEEEVESSANAELLSIESTNEESPDQTVNNAVAEAVAEQTGEDDKQEAMPF